LHAVSRILGKSKGHPLSLSPFVFIPPLNEVGYLRFV
jgi:hypothetical protein